MNELVVDEKGSNIGDNKYVICTSLNGRLWQKFMHRTVGSLFKAYAETDQPVIFWLDSDEDRLCFDGIGLTDNMKMSILDRNPVWLDFARKFGGNVPFTERGIDPAKIDPGHQFRLNKYMAFAKKVYSWCLTYSQLKENQVLVWIDGDVIMHKPCTNEVFDDFLPEGMDICYLDRSRPWYAVETGFFMIRKTEASDQFVNLFLAIYSSGFLFDMSEWNDAFVFKAILKLCPQLRQLNLNPVLMERDVFERTKLADFMEHYKGTRKNELKDNPNSPMGQDTCIDFDPEAQ